MCVMALPQQKKSLKKPNKVWNLTMHTLFYIQLLNIIIVLIISFFYCGSNTSLSTELSYLWIRRRKNRPKAAATHNNEKTKHLFKKSKFFHFQFEWKNQFKEIFFLFYFKKERKKSLFFLDKYFIFGTALAHQETTN